MNASQYAVMLKDRRYWVEGPLAQPTADIDAATHYASRWLALGAISRAGAGVMHMASIVPYQPREEGEAKPPENSPVERPASGRT